LYTISSHMLGVARSNLHTTIVVFDDIYGCGYALGR